MTAPAIAISGVVDGQLTNQAVTIGFSVTDAHLGAVSATLDTAAFASGSTVSAEGKHTLVVTASDLAGSTSKTTVHFEIDLTSPQSPSLA